MQAGDAFPERRVGVGEVDTEVAGRALDQLADTVLPGGGRAEEVFQRHRPAPVEVCVVLPGVADPAEQRDRLQADRGGTREALDGGGGGGGGGELRVGLLTPATVHHGHAETVRAARAAVLDTAHAARPDRFVHRSPTPPELPRPAWINRPGPTPDQPTDNTDQPAQ